VVKDYGRYRRTPLSPLARLLVRREARVLGLLRGWRHAPALLGTIGGLALGIEFIPGVMLGEIAMDAGSQVFQQLRGAVASLHAAGITHNDLHPANVLVAGSTPVLIDFASALRTPRWLRWLPLARELRRSDLANIAKMRQRMTGQVPSAREAQLLAPPRWVDALRLGWKRIYRRLKGG
jgi:predicted Ser/Thr protein kinase